MKNAILAPLHRGAVAPEVFAFEPTLDHLPFANTVERDLAEKGTHPRSVLPFVGGESAALERVRYYIWESECIATYFETRRGRCTSKSVDTAVEKIRPIFCQCYKV